MKKTSGFLATTLLFCVLAVSGTVQADTYEDFSYYVREDDTIVIESYTGQDSVVTIPDQIQDKPVVGIGDYAFEACDNLEEVYLPDDLTEVGSSAFYGYEGWIYTDLESKTAQTLSHNGIWFNISGFPNVSLQYEYRYDETTNSDIPTGELDVFAKDNGITSAEIPEGVTRIGTSGFQDCDNLAELVIPEGVKCICEYALDNCDSLTSADLPESLVEIRQNAFCNSMNLTELDLPEGLKIIGSEVFYHCENLQGVTLPDGVTDVAPGAFSEYYGRIYASPDTTAAYALSQNDGYFCISGFPDVKLRYEYAYDETTEQYLLTGELDAFAWNDGISSAVVPGVATRIGAYGFYNCDYLTEIEIQNGVKCICEYGLDNCDALTGVTIPESLVELRHNAFCNSSNLPELDLPEGLKIIGSEVFYNCENLQEVTLPDG